MGKTCDVADLIADLIKSIDNSLPRHYRLDYYSVWIRRNADLTEDVDVVVLCENAYHTDYVVFSFWGKLGDFDFNKTEVGHYTLKGGAKTVIVDAEEFRASRGYNQYIVVNSVNKLSKSEQAALDYINGLLCGRKVY